MLADVLAAARRGWHVFPLVPGTKRPSVDEWETRATTSEPTIRRFWAERPDANYGIACGPSHLVVVDLDVHQDDHGEFTANGVQDWSTLLTQVGKQDWDDTLEVTTPSGGIHVYYRPGLGDDACYRNTSRRLGPAIDTRANGGFVVGPGSTDDRGSWAVWRTRSVQVVPPWLDNLLRPRASPVPLREVNGHQGRWHGVIGRMAVATEGERNSVLHWCACRLVEERAPVEALDALHLAAQRAGLGDREIETTIRSAIGGHHA